MTPRLTKPQRRILDEAKRAASTDVPPAIVYGRNMPAVDKLNTLGLITVRWRLDESGQQTRWVGEARATPAGVAA